MHTAVISWTAGNVIALNLEHCGLVSGAGGNTGTSGEAGATVALPVPSPAKKRPGSGTGRVQKSRFYLLLGSGVKNMYGDKKTPKLGTGLDLPAKAASHGASPACADPWGCTGFEGKGS